MPYGTSTVAFHCIPCWWPAVLQWLCSSWVGGSGVGFNTPPVELLQVWASIKPIEMVLCVMQVNTCQGQIWAAFRNFLLGTRDWSWVSGTYVKWCTELLRIEYWSAAFISGRQAQLIMRNCTCSCDVWKTQFFSCGFYKWVFSFWMHICFEPSEFFTLLWESV